MHIKINHNANGHESFDYLAEQFEDNVNRYNRAIEIGDFKGQAIYFGKASLLQEILVDLFDAEVPSWYE